MAKKAARNDIGSYILVKISTDAVWLCEMESYKNYRYNREEKDDFPLLWALLGQLTTGSKRVLCFICDNGVLLELDDLIDLRSLAWLGNLEDLAGLTSVEILVASFIKLATSSTWSSSSSCKCLNRCKKCWCHFPPIFPISLVTLCWSACRSEMISSSSRMFLNSLSIVFSLCLDISSGMIISFCSCSSMSRLFVRNIASV
jgi:hypothetical protein